LKKAFTMLELIFTIVIIGILGTIAIPKLIATREDAETSKELMRLSVYIKDITTYYMATGKVDTNRTSDKPRCFDSSVVDINKTLTISITTGGIDNGQAYCTKAQLVAEDKNLLGTQVLTIGGTLVEY